jgi:hypothetical protein
MGEVAERERRVRGMAAELAVALRMAHRLILSAPDFAYPRHVWNNCWPTVNYAVERLILAEGGL